MADEEKLLVSMMKAGNSFAFEKLYYRYCKKLYNFVFSIIKNKEDAEGIVQLVFMKVWEKRTEIDLRNLSVDMCSGLPETTC